MHRPHRIPLCQRAWSPHTGVEVGLRPRLRLRATLTLCHVRLRMCLCHLIHHHRRRAVARVRPLLLLRYLPLFLRPLPPPALLLSLLRRRRMTQQRRPLQRQPLLLRVATPTLALMGIMLSSPSATMGARCCPTWIRNGRLGPLYVCLGLSPRRVLRIVPTMRHVLVLLSRLRFLLPLCRSRLSLRLRVRVRAVVISLPALQLLRAMPALLRRRPRVKFFRLHHLLLLLPLFSLLLFFLLHGVGNVGVVRMWLAAILALRRLLLSRTSRCTLKCRSARRQRRLLFSVSCVATLLLLKPCDDALDARAALTCHAPP